VDAVDEVFDSFIVSFVPLFKVKCRMNFCAAIFSELLCILTFCLSIGSIAQGGDGNLKYWAGSMNCLYLFVNSAWYGFGRRSVSLPLFDTVADAFESDESMREFELRFRYYYSELGGIVGPGPPLISYLAIPFILPMYFTAYITTIFCHCACRNEDNYDRRNSAFFGVLCGSIFYGLLGFTNFTAPLLLNLIITLVDEYYLARLSHCTTEVFIFRLATGGLFEVVGSLTNICNLSLFCFTCPRVVSSVVPIADVRTH